MAIEYVSALQSKNSRVADEIQRAGSFSETCPVRSSITSFPRDVAGSTDLAPNRPQRDPYTGRGARTVGLIGDRTRDRLQHPLRREHLACEPLFQHGCLIKGLGQRFEDGFHNVVRIAAVYEIHVEIEPAVGDEGLEKIFEQS